MNKVNRLNKMNKKNSILYEEKGYFFCKLLVCFLLKEIYFREHWSLGDDFGGGQNSFKCSGCSAEEPPEFIRINAGASFRISA